MIGPSSVLHATKNGTIVSCTEARWICSADAECGKALEYYQLYCQSMFRGRKCTQRCKNSWNILHRQEKAEKLVNCECQNDELFDTFECQDIKDNMESLCLDQADDDVVVGDENINVETTGDLTNFLLFFHFEPARYAIRWDILFTPIRGRGVIFDG